MKFTLITTVRNEGPYLWEWVAYHRMIGFDDIIVFQNDSNDGTDQILRLMQSHGLVRYIYNRAEAGKHQVRAYFRATRQAEYTSADYVMALDLDEFLMIHAGGGALSDFMAAVPAFDCAYINWRIFGSSNHATIPRGLVSETFLMGEYAHKVISRHSAFKSLFRRDRFTRPGIHKPFLRNAAKAASPVCINGSGLGVDAFDLRNFQSKDPLQMRHAQVNHYMVRDAASFVLKSARGSAHQTERQIREKYWLMRNINQQLDTRLAQRGDETRRVMHQLDDLTEGQLSQLTGASHRFHRKAFRKLIQSEHYKQLYDFCVQNLAGHDRPRQAMTTAFAAPMPRQHDAS